MHFYADFRRLRPACNLIFAALLAGLAAAANQSQTITFPAIPDLLLGVSPFSITAHADSNLPVSFSSATPTVCKVSGAWVLPLTAGSCSIQASQPGSGTYAAAAWVTQTFTIQATRPAGVMKSSQISIGSTYPNGIAVADFDHDGMPDAAITALGGTLTIAYGGVSGIASTASTTFVDTTLYAVAVADLNRDGNPDLVIAANDAHGFSKVIRLIGHDNGVLTRQDALSIDGIAALSAIAVGDFNGDGLQDVAIADQLGKVTVLKGDGTGNLTSLSSFSPLQGAITSIVSADVNHDGFMDLIVAYPDFNQVIVYTANSTGAFSLAAQFLMGASAGPNALAVGDFNKDGNPDFAVTLAGTNQVALFTSDDSGHFTETGTRVTVGAGPMSIVAGDFNGDGNQDFAVGVKGVSSNGVYFLLGDSTGAFTAAGPQLDYPVTSSGNIWLAAGDFNNDHREDLISANNGSDKLTVLTGALAHTSTVLSTTAASSVFQGVSVPLTATVTPPGQYFGVFAGGSVTFYDNGVPMTTVSGASPYLYTASLSVGSHTLTAAFSNTTPGFDGSATATPLSITVLSKLSQTITFAPLSDRSMSPLPIQLTATSDSNLPVTLSSITTSICTVDGNLLTLRSVGQCSITASQPGNDTTYNAATPVVRQFNISIASQRIRVGSVPHPTVGLPPFEFPVQADSLLPVSLTSLTPSVCSLSATLVTPLSAGTCTLRASQAGNANYNPAPAVEKSFDVKLATPSGVLTPGTSIPVSGVSPFGLATGDFNNDGFSDLAVLNTDTNSVSVLLGDVSGAFHPLSNTFSTPGSPVALVAGDFNADGYSDLAVSTSDDGSIAVLLGGPGGALTPALGSPFAPGANAFSMAVGDFNGDGIEDLAAVESPGGDALSGGNVTIFTGNGQGGFSQASQTILDGVLVELAVGDFDNNGKQDVAALDFENNQVFILLGDGNGGFLASPAAAPVGRFPFGISVGDFDGNGNPDLAVVNLQDSDVTLLVGDGEGGFQVAPSSPSTGQEPGSLVVGDFNGDGVADIGAGSVDGFTLLKNNGSLTFVQPAGSPFTLPFPFKMVTGDFNNDGRLDVAAMSENQDQINILLGAAAPTTSSLSITSPVPAPIGSTVSLSLTVSNTGTSINPLSGTATIVVGGVPIFTAPESTSPFTFQTSGFLAGQHTLTAHFAGANGSGDSDSNPVTFDVQESQTISFGPLSDIALLKSPLQISATATSGLPVVFTSGSISVCTVTGSTVTLLAAGKCTIQANQSGNHSWAPAPEVAVQFNVAAPAQQTITFPVIPDQRYGTTPFVIAAKSDSGLTVALASTTHDVCSTAGTLVTILTPGTCQIEATQAGNTSYDPASPVTRQFLIQNAAPAGILAIAHGSPIAIGGAPQGVATGDLNHDGLIDFIVADNSGDSVTVLLTDGTGGYATTHFATGHLPTCVTIADFDRDGNSDFAVVNNSNTITVYRGDGHGAFTEVAGSPFATGLTSPNRAAVGDFDGDGIPDLAVSADAGTAFSIMTGVGDGTFHTGTSQSVSATPLAIAVGDFNRDGSPDLAIALSDNTVAVLNGNSAGEFAADTHGPFAVGGSPSAILADDFNNDGKTDLATANKSDGTVSILIGDGAGNFTQPNGPVAAGASPASLAAGDYNGDGFVDLVVANQDVGLLLNNGDGSFRTEPHFDGGSTIPHSVAAADFNNDGAIDLALTSPNGGGKLTLFRGAANPTGTTLSTTSPLTVTTGAQISFDIAVTHTGGAEYELPHGSVTVSDNANQIGSATQSVAPYTFTTAALTAGSHTFTAAYSGDRRSGNSTSAPVIILALAPQTITFGPLSNKVLGSGQILLTATASSGLAVSYSTNSTACSVSNGVVTLLSAGSCAIKASQAGDSSLWAPAPDVTQSFNITQPQTITFTPILSHFVGDSPFPIAARASSGLPVTLTSTTLSVCKLTGDLVVTLASGNCSIDATQGGGSGFEPATRVTRSFTVRTAARSGAFTASPIGPYSTGDGPVAVALGDFNGDGRQDFVTANGEGKNVTVVLANSDGPGNSFSVGATPVSVSTGDFNSDGKQDIAVLTNESSLAILLGRGDGTFETGTPVTVGSAAQSIAVGDLDGDNIEDIVVAESGLNQVRILKGDGLGHFTSTLVNAGRSPYAVALGDYDGDGVPDIAVANNDGHATVLTNHLASGFTSSAFTTASGSNTIVAADFDHDRKLDLAVGNAGSSTVTFLINGASSSLTLPGPPESLSVGDFNGDGLPDLAIVTSSGVVTALSAGDGTFTTQIGGNFAADLSPTSGITGDFDNDGFLDLLTVSASTNKVNLQNGGPAVVSLTLSTPMRTPVTQGTPVPLIATLSLTTPVFRTPSGSVTFLDGDSPLGAALQSPYTFTAAGLTQGSHSFFASYEGDSQTAPATSDILTFAVVLPTPQTITFGPLSDKIKGSGNVTLAATASSGLPVTFSTASSACSVTDNIVTLSGPGVCVIRASQPGDSVYAPASDVVQQFTITLPQTISFDAIPNRIFGASPFTTAARATSGLAITLTSATPAVCKTARDLVMLLSSGTCQIQATQPGGSGYAAATPVTQSFTVRSAVPGGAFISAAPIAAGASARTAVVGDFNGDFTPDLAVADTAVPGNVTVLLGPHFSSASSHSVGASPYSIAIGDFNVDGNLDLVTPNLADNSVSVLRGDGAGAFTATTLNSFNSPLAVAIGDFGGDGWQDLAVANGGANNISLVSFNGQEFIPLHTFAAGTQPSAIAMGDFNGDGKQDLAIANQGSNDVTVLLGADAGNFIPAPGSPYAVGAAPVHLAVGDFNLDGVADLAVANSGGAGSISVLKGIGDGSFAAFASSPLGAAKFESVAVSDFNGDGNPDIAAATYAQSGSVSIFLGDGRGGFSALPSTFAVGPFPAGLVATDLNADGIADLVATSSGDGTVSVLLGAAPQTITFAPIGAVQVGAHIDLSATASSGLPVTFASSTASVCAVIDTSAVAVSAGTCTIVASQAGNGTYPPASVSRSFEITAPPPPPQAPQTISFGSLGNVAFGSQPFSITASANSGLPVTFSSGSPSVCSVADNLVSILAAGTCSITAIQNGNFAFLAADPVTQSFTVLSAVTLTTSSLPNGIVGAGYTAALAAKGGNGGPYSWSATSLPQGIGLGSNGLLTGNPSAAGTFTFTVQASDGFSPPASAWLSITVFGPLSITTTSLPNGIAGTTYAPRSLSAKGGSGSYTWTASGLPGGLALSSAGSLSGTPAAAGDAVVSITATDTNTGQTLTVTIPLSVVPASTTLKANPSSLTAGAGVGASITGSFTATGGTPPYKFSAAGLPAGISLDESGSLSGSSSAAGTYNVTVTLTDSAKAPATATAQLTVNIFGITSTSLNNGAATVFYSSAFQALGGVPPIAFSATGLPAGLSLSGDGALTGTVTSSGAFDFTVQASDSSGLTSSRSFTLTMAKAPVSAKALSLPDGTVKTPYSGSLQATGGSPGYSWSLIGGALPAGLSLSSSGVVSGIPTAPGTSTIGVQVNDSTGGVASGSVSITIAPAPIAVSTGALPSGVVNFYYGPQIIDITGGVAPYTFELSGSLPAGLSLSGNVISGTPTAAGSFPFTLKVTDAQGTKADAPSSIVIRPPASDLLLLSGSVSFSLAQGATVLPAAQSVGVQSTVVADSISYSASASSGANWLTVTGSGTTPGAVSLALNDAALSLPLGSNSATVTVTCTSSTCQGKSQTIAVSLTVSSPPAQLGVDNSVLSFNSVSALSQPIQIQNIGGGALGILSVSCDAPWCSAGSFSASLTGGASTQVTIAASATGLASGSYRAAVNITSSAGSASVPVTFLVTDRAIMTLTPSGTQFDMAAGGQPGSVHGSFEIASAGGAIQWTAAARNDAPWLTLETAAGSSSGAVTYSINNGAASLLPGAHYATIEVTSPDASNSPQDYQIVLNVAPANAPPHLTPSPGGLTFDRSTTSQVITVYSTSSGPTAYQASASTVDGANWLSVTPTGSASSGAPGTSTLTIQTTGLTAGVYTGSVSIAGGSSGISVVNVSLIIPASAPVPHAAKADGLAPRDSCAAANVVPAQIGLVNSFSTPASWPTPLAVQLSDDCGNVISDGQVIATFSNGDPPLAFTLSSAAKGVYSGTWTPRASTSRITIKARGSKTGLTPATAELSGAVVPNAAPSTDPNGVVNPFAPTVGGPLAPGTIVAIYGSHLASQPAQPTEIPLPVKLNATSVLIGGIQSPLFYVGPGQINAQIPFELNASQQYQVIVNANGALTPPQTIQLTAANPGIDTFPDGSLVAVHAADGTLISATSPAQRGEYVVLFLLGLGATDNPVSTGDSPPPTVLARAAVQPVITMNGNPVPIAFAGLTPGLVGLYQVNLQIPDNQPGGNVAIGVSQGGTAGNSGILPIAY